MSKLGLPSLFTPEGLLSHVAYINFFTTFDHFLGEIGNTDSTFWTALLSIPYVGDLGIFLAFFWALYLCCLSLSLFLTFSKFSFHFFFPRSGSFFLKSSEECFSFNFSGYFFRRSVFVIGMQAFMQTVLLMSVFWANIEFLNVVKCRYGSWGAVSSAVRSWWSPGWSSGAKTRENVGLFTFGGQINRLK